MQFKFSAAAALAFVASAIAQTTGFDSVYSPSSWEKIPAGQTFKIEWSVPDAYKGTTVSISLIGGETQGTQVPLLDIVSGISNDALEYDWAVPADLGAANVYGLIIKLSDDSSVFQYSNPFQIVAAETTSTTVAPATTSAYSVKTVSLSSQSSEVAAADYTTVVPVVNTVTVPCNGTTPAPYTIPQATAPVVPPHYNNATWSTAVAPATTAGGSSSGSATETPAAVTGAGARFAAGPIAIFGGLLVAAFAL